MALLVLDSSVLIAYFSPTDRLHERAVGALRAAADEEKIVIATVLAEILVHPYRVGPAAVRTIGAAFDALVIRVEPVTREIARRAAEIRAQRATLRLADALVVASGDVLDAHVLTADRSWRALSPRIRAL